MRLLGAFIMHRGKAAGLGLTGLLLASPAWAQQVAAADDVEGLSIEQLANVEITSVSKAPQSLSTAAAAVYVISHDDIVRSGAISLPEMLRLAPNLEVMQTSPRAIRSPRAASTATMPTRIFPTSCWC